MIRVDKKYFRPTEVDILHGDYTKAKENLGWNPKISFQELVKEMIKCELKNFSIDYLDMIVTNATVKLSSLLIVKLK